MISLIRNKSPADPRAIDNNKIVNILVGQANNADLTVVPIVGMGGLGKTTVAQLVYNDPEIQKHFDVLLWVCVSNNFDVDSLAKSIVEAAPRNMNVGRESTVISNKKKTPLDILQNVLSGQRYLLVLDDVWTREDRKWGQLKARLEHGGMGSVILTTTRDKVVAEIMGTVEAYNLEALGGLYLKEIIETTTFSRLKVEEERPTVLVNMVGEIMERCAGSPLAAIALGSILRNKASEEEWKAVSRRSNICTEESGILPILKLSYNDLPSHMKQCFSFCAIFPKDYDIDVGKLIQLWIAHGFIIQEEQVRLETIGKQIFNELVTRSFFQDVKLVQAIDMDTRRTGACYSRTTCKIHDLMHDVALSVLEKECAFATEEPSQSEWLRNTARHLFLTCKEPGTKLNSSLENSSPAIQTLLCVGYLESSLQHLPKYRSLQALQLCSLRSSFPLKPKHLHHLRYLDLSRSHIKALPEDMSILYNLQTLNLSGCIFLGELPRQMEYMTALCYLYTHGCNALKSMPRNLRKLTSLETLTCFVAGSGSNCSNVGELGSLNLGGQLELCHLENVTAEDAEAANLMKKELRELALKWTVRWDDSSKEIDIEGDSGVLEKLKPHDGLQTIRINSYRATTSPTWMIMLRNIVEIHIFRCAKVTYFISSNSGGTSSFSFPNLKKLKLEGLACLERCLETNSEEQQEEIMFPKLEKMFISHCVNLTSLPGHLTFPNLQNVCIEVSGICNLYSSGGQRP
uniref:Putative resistance protein n=1 Tax=Avena strigosa TaxID=38783 RepID=C3V015_9POAL|nr:putative resistance protein [Avena strigosa]